MIMPLEMLHSFSSKFRNVCRGGVAGLVLMILMAVAAAATEPAAPTPQRIDEAIAKAKQYIYSQQQEGGRWEKDDVRQGTEHSGFVHMQGDSFGGYTALATYALLVSGESPNDPRIKSAVEFLKHADMVGIYAIALRCQVWLLISHNTPQM